MHHEPYTQLPGLNLPEHTWKKNTANSSLQKTSNFNRQSDERGSSNPHHDVNGIRSADPNELPKFLKVGERATGLG